jgi:hypothetical protein
MAEDGPSGFRRWVATRAGVRDDGPRVAELAERLHAVTATLGQTDDAAEPRGVLAALEQEVAAVTQVASNLTRLGVRIESQVAALAGVEVAGGEVNLERRLQAVDALADDARAKAAAGGPSATAQQLMALLDRVSLAVAADGAGADPLLAWLRDRLVEILAGEGVALIDERGQVDPARHEVVEARATTEPELGRTISATVRPGYEHAGVVLRAQQVVIWKHAGPGRGAGRA